MAARVYRPRRVQLAGGESLALRRDGSIHHLDRDGELLESWAQGAAGWPERAIRFGLFPSPTTVHPSGRGEPDRYPPA